MRNLLAELKEKGVQLGISSAGKLEASGDRETVERYLPLLREHKVELLATLRRPARKNFTIGYQCPCGCISYLPKTFRWGDIHGGKHWGFSCLNCETRYWFV